MKRCPECRRDYYDDTLLYCLDDGNALLEGPATASGGDEPATAILHSTAAPGEAATRAQINTTDHTAVWPSSNTELRKARLDKRRLAVPFLLVIIVGGSVFGVYKYYSGRGTTATPGSANMKISRVTSTGKATHAAISPDGNYIVHSMADSGKESIWVRQTATGSNVQIVPPSDVVHYGITFSRDGNYLFLVSREIGAGTGKLTRVPVLGGNPMTLIKDVDGPVTFSPDGQQMAFARWNPRERNSGVWSANVDGTNERRLAVRELPDEFSGGPAWSPDGKVIVCGLRAIEGGTAYLTAIAIDAGDGAQKVFTSQRWNPAASRAARLTWFGDNSLIMNAADQAGGNNAQIWQISFPDGAAQPLTHDLNNYEDLSLTRDATALVTVQSERQTNVWLAPEGDARRARQITSGKGSDGERVAWTPDGKIVYDSQVSGNQEIWVMDASGSQQRQLTNDVHSDRTPTVSPDGRYIIFASSRSGAIEIWRMNVDGSNPIRLSTGNSRGNPPVITPDGHSVVFTGEGTGTWKVPIEGGAAEPIALKGGSGPSAVATDGRVAKWAYLEKQPGEDITRRSLSIALLGDDLKQQFLDIPQTVAFTVSPQWGSDGRALFYVDTLGGVSNIWSYSFAGGKSKQVTNFESDQIFGFAFSPEGKQLAVTRGSVTNDVVLIKDFK